MVQLLGSKKFKINYRLIWISKISCFLLKLELIFDHIYMQWWVVTFKKYANFYIFVWRMLKCECMNSKEHKRFYNRETLPFVRISQLAESPSTLSWLAEILALKRGLIIWVASKTFGLIHNSTRQLFLYYKISFLASV